MDEIEKLLEQADTPRDRAYLLVMYKIADRLGDVSDKLTEHRNEFVEHREQVTMQHKVFASLFNTFDNKFDLHVKDEQALVNKGLGAWMVITMVLVVVFSLGGWYVVRHVLDVAQQQATVIERNSNRLTAIETMIEQHLRTNGQK